MNNIFSKIPLLRFLLPLVIGILLSCTQLNIYIAIGLLLFGCIIYIITVKNKDTYIQYKRNYRYSIALFLIVIALGWINAQLLAPRNISHEESNYSTVIAHVDHIKDNDYSMSLTISLKGYIDSCGNIINPKPLKAIVNIEGNNYILKEGDLISFTPNFERIKNMGNPNEFDYAKYMEHQGIIYTQHIKSTDYSIVGYSPTIFTIAKQCQRYLINRIHSSALSVPSQQFIITALLGDKYIIDEDIRESFSAVGMAHILAVSGLHVGIITIIFAMLFYPLARFNLHRCRLILTLIVLVIYAFITGLSPSVMRSTIMVAFFIISFILYRENTGLNALCGAALFIFIISPMAIYSIGLQLSFLAVATILIFANKINPFSPKEKLKYYICSLFSVPISAMIGTGIVSAYYFHTFPIFFLVGNVILIPMLPAILGFAILYIIYPLPIFSEIIDFIYNIFISIVQYIQKIPCANIDNISLTVIDIAIYFMVILFITVWIKQRKAIFLLITMSIILIWLMIKPFTFNKIESAGIVIFNDYTETPFIYYESSVGYLIFPDDNESIDKIRKYNNNFLLNQNIKSLIEVTDTLRTPQAMISVPYAFCCGKKIAVIGSNNWKKAVNGITAKIDIDYLVITKNYYGKIARLLKLYNPNTIVLSGNIFPKRLLELENECRVLNLKYYSISKNGALSIIQ